MPPEGKADPVSDAEPALLEMWVVEGAGFGGLGRRRVKASDPVAPISDF